MVRTQIYLTEDQRAEIATIANRSGKRQSEITTVTAAGNAGRSACSVVQREPGARAFRN